MAHSNHLVFVYGGLRRGFTTNDVMERWGAEHMAAASYQAGHSRMVSLGAMPGLVPDNSEAAPDIVGDLYRVSWPALQALDRLECAPHFFRRVKARVTTEGGEERRAWMYVLANPSRFSDAKVVESGDWLAYLGHQLGDYLGLIDKARKGDKLPKEFDMMESATCELPYKASNTNTSSTSSTTSTDDSRYESYWTRKETETKYREDQWTEEWTRRNQRLLDIKARNEKLEQDAEARKKKIELANRIYGRGSAIADDSKFFSESVVKTINALEKNRHCIVQSIGGSIVTFKRNDDGIIEVIGWHSKWKENDELNPEPPPKVQVVQDYAAEAVSECVYCQEVIEYIPMVGWVGENLSPQCLLAVGKSSCHAAPEEVDDAVTQDSGAWGDGGND